MPHYLDMPFWLAIARFSSHRRDFAASNLALHHVLKLLDNGSNWITYRKRVLTEVSSRGLKRHLEGRAKKPREVVDIDAGTTEEPDGLNPVIPRHLSSARQMAPEPTVYHALLVCSTSISGTSIS